jgi:uncharacterized protein YbjT (DUF2867 family)
VVVDRLRAQGHDVRVVSRHSPTWPIDLRDGSGLASALDGADAIVHCASTPTGGDTDSARHLVSAAEAAGVRHLVFISIVGVDVVPLGYYRMKLAAECVIEESNVGWTIQRATQFHNLVARLLATSARVPFLMLVPSFRFQSVDLHDVAARLSELAVGDPVGRAPDLGGPEVRTAVDLAHSYLRSRALRRRVVPLRLPGKLFGAYQRGGNLVPEHADGKITFDEFLPRSTVNRPPRTLGTAFVLVTGPQPSRRTEIP